MEYRQFATSNKLLDLDIKYQWLLTSLKNDSSRYQVPPDKHNTYYSLAKEITPESDQASGSHEKNLQDTYRTERHAELHH